MKLGQKYILINEENPVDAMAGYFANHCVSLSPTGLPNQIQSVCLGNTTIFHSLGSPNPTTAFAFRHPIYEEMVILRLNKGLNEKAVYQVFAPILDDTNAGEYRKKRLSLLKTLAEAGL